jgi:hypothetical protein
MTKDEALKLALEALENGMKFVWSGPEIDAIKEALAKPVQEPVGSVVRWLDGSLIHGWFGDPPPEGTLLYTDPPKREWVGLTEQDMPGGEDPMFDHQYFIAGMVYASTFLKEKNT